MVGLSTPAHASDWLLISRSLFLTIHVLGIFCFAYIVARRLVPLVRAERDFRFDHPLTRAGRVLQFWLGQWKHPRYKFAGILHIFIFAGFILLVVRAFSLLIVGADQTFETAGAGSVTHIYDQLTDYAATVVFLCMIIAVLRRLVFKPARYSVPAKYGKGHTADAIFLLAMATASCAWLIVVGYDFGNRLHSLSRS